MPVPHTVFIDTATFQAAQFHFSARQFRALLAAVPRNARLRLLLPAATVGEIDRRMIAAAADAINALKAARNAHPLLGKLAHFPQNPAADTAVLTSLRSRLETEWAEFKNQFDVVELDYSEIDLAEIMTWYQEQKPPFGAGDKRKEFPDAFAFAAIRNYSRRTGELVAVVSPDNDFKHACTGVSNLIYFNETAPFTSALLAQEARFADAARLAAGLRSEIISRIGSIFPDRAFDHADDPDGRGAVEDVTVISVRLEDDALVVVELDDNGFEVQFTATVEYEAHASYSDPDSWISGDPGDGVFYLHTRAGTVTDEAEVNGTIRFSVDDEWQSAEIASCAIDEDHIEMTAAAPEEDDQDEEDRFDEEPGARG